MAVNQGFKEHIENQLFDFGDLTFKNMFGGVGIFKNSLMFAKIGGDKFWLRVDEVNQPEFEQAGMKPFYSEKKKKGMPYWQVPTNIIDNQQEITKWAAKAFEAALRNAK